MYIYTVFTVWLLVVESSCKVVTEDIDNDISVLVDIKVINVIDTNQEKVENDPENYPTQEIVDVVDVKVIPLKKFVWFKIIEEKLNNKSMPDADVIDTNKEKPNRYGIII